VEVRRFAIALIVAVCLGGPIVEMFDQWDHTFQDGNDTEANVVVVALCVGAALSVARILVTRIRALSAHVVGDIVFACAPVRLKTPFFLIPLPTASPPTPLRV
jgi:hypothetical protein